MNIMMLSKIRPRTFIVALAVLQGLALVATRLTCWYFTNLKFCVDPNTGDVVVVSSWIAALIVSFAISSRN